MKSGGQIQIETRQEILRFIRNILDRHPDEWRSATQESQEKSGMSFDGVLPCLLHCIDTTVIRL
jgi:hypothetical protein